MRGADAYAKEVPGVIRHEWRRAYKVHPCDECAAPIPKLRHYAYVTGRWEGQWIDYRECEKCWAIRNAFHDVLGSWPGHGDLLKEVADCLRAKRGTPAVRHFGTRLRVHLGRQVYGPALPAAPSRAEARAA
jgi:hypothetical protein